MAAALPNPSFASCIARLPNPAGSTNRARWLKKISANANAPGAGKKQTRGRGRQGCSSLPNRLGIYPIETTVTAPLAASVGGASPATFTIAGGTPASTVIATNELDPITWAGAGTKTIIVSVNAYGAQGQADVVV